MVLFFNINPSKIINFRKNLILSLGEEITSIKMKDKLFSKTKIFLYLTGAKLIN